MPVLDIRLIFFKYQIVCVPQTFLLHSIDDRGCNTKQTVQVDVVVSRTVPYYSKK